MITYVGFGDRQLDQDPAVYARSHHELLVVFQGRCGLIKDGHPSTLRASHLWLLPIGSHHAWRGDGRGCRLLSVMLSKLGDPLAQRVRAADGLDLALEAAARDRFAALGARLFADRADYSVMRHLEQVVLGEIGLVFRASDVVAPAHWRVEHALTWFEEHMHLAPHCDDIAAAVGCSGGHLRRLFQVAGQAPLGDRLDERRLARAMALLAQGSWTTAHIARQCGWRTAGALTHAMRRHHHCSVREWLAGRGLR